MSSSIGTDRPSVPDEKIIRAMNELYDNLKKRLDQKGYGSFKSSHEIYGIIAEETNIELLGAIHKNEPLSEIQKELLDIAVACIFGYASIENGTVDW